MTTEEQHKIALAMHRAFTLGTDFESKMVDYFRTLDARTLQQERRNLEQNYAKQLKTLIEEVTQ